MKIAETLKMLRREKLITQDELSISSGLSQGHISNIENGGRKPTAKAIKKISKGLGIDVSIILFKSLEEDIDPEKIEIFYQLQPAIEDFLNELI